MQSIFRIRNSFALVLNKPAKIWKQKEYEAIPYYLRANFIDEHDSYITRTLNQVKEELQDKQFQIQIRKVVYRPTEPFAAMKGRRVNLIVKIEQFHFTELQFSRFKVLVGSRYKQKTDQLYLSCEVYDSYTQNLTKINQMLFQIIVQAKRAP